jgi:arylsulfatase A-like enzyme
MHRAVILIAIVAALAPRAACCGEARSLSQADPKRPNVLLIVADDLGYGELGCYGGKTVPTPNIDALAKGGVRFTAGYVSCPVCSPTRAGLLTGRYQQRFGHEFNPAALARAGAVFGLPLGETTMAERFRKAGYRTGMVGKWHLGDTPAHHPLSRGFEEYFGFLGGAHAYFPPREGAPARRRAPILRGTEAVEEKEYLTTAFTREAVAYIRRHAKEPFFLYLTYNAVHNPLEATAEHLERFRGVSDLKRRKFAAMLAALDDGVGSVLGALREAGIEDDTLVFFLSDNGGPTLATTSSNGPLRGVKGQAFEGGIRVPFIAQWKARLPQGRTFDQPVIALDVLPTALAAAGIDLAADAKLDGVDLLPHLNASAANAPHEFLYWRFGDRAAARRGQWKLVRQGRGAAWQLFDLATDSGEANDLTATRPETAAELRKAFESWERELAEPLWEPAWARRRARL